MKLTLDRRAIDAVPASWLVLGVFEDETEPPEAVRGTALEAKIARMIADKELTGSFGEMLPLYQGHGLEVGSVLLVGLGQRARFEPGTAFSAGFAVSKRLAAKRRDTVTIVLPHADDLPATASAMIEGAIVGTKSPALKKSEPNRHEFNELTLLIDPKLAAPELPVLERALRRGEIVGQAVNLARAGQHSRDGEIAATLGRAGRPRGDRGGHCR